MLDDLTFDIPSQQCCDDVHQNWSITNERLKLELNLRSCKHGSSMLEVAVGLVCQWIQANGRSGMRKISMKSMRDVQFAQFERNMLKEYKEILKITGRWNIITH